MTEIRRYFYGKQGERHVDYDATISEDVDLGYGGIKKGTYHYQFGKPYIVDDVAYNPNITIGTHVYGNCYFNKSGGKMMLDIAPLFHKQYFFNKKSN
jgi:hypothetical protein